MSSITSAAVRNIIGVNNGAPSRFPNGEYILSFGIEELDVFRTVAHALIKFQDDINHEIVTNGMIDFLTMNYVSDIMLMNGSLIITVAQK